MALNGPGKFAQYIDTQRLCLCTQVHTANRCHLKVAMSGCPVAKDTACHISPAFISGVSGQHGKSIEQLSTLFDGSFFLVASCMDYICPLASILHYSFAG